MAFALGASWHREELAQSWNPAMRTGDISGYAGTFTDVNQSRDAWAVYGELGIPIVKSVEGTIAVRYDHYTDFGGTTNPKLTLRWQPSKEVLLRGSYGTGFLAPTLYELYVPDNNSMTVNGLSDPIRCPVTQNVGTDCKTQFQDTFGGSRYLKPETSFQVNAGIVLAPARGLSLTVDWFKVNLANQITTGPNPGYILDPANYDQYAYLVERAAPDADNPGLPGRITNIVQRYVNQGSIHIVGWDASLKYAFPKADTGQFTFNMNGTYFSKYDYQLPNGAYLGQVANAGAPGISNAGVIPRWKHYAQLNWNLGPWSATLGNTYQTSYIDQYTDLDGNVRRVSSMSLWDLQFDYTGLENWKLSLGAKNVMDANPPFTNQTWQFQSGYDPTYYDPNARFVYASVTYSFGGR
jgi:iron complex outermembrane receptor protein